MPVRSLSSRVFKWPLRDDVLAALRDWAARQKMLRPEMTRAGCFGSLAHGDWGFGSDADVVVVVRESGRPPIERPRDWDTSGLPVPVDLIIYTEDELARILADGSRWSREMNNLLWLTA